MATRDVMAFHDLRNSCHPTLEVFDLVRVHILRRR